MGYPIKRGGMSDKVSIIIPCYNQAHFLPDAIESALAQTYTDIEIIVVNDGSPDDTSAVARRYPKVRLIEKANGGLSSARNAGIKAANGVYILPLDADDKLHPQFISKTIGVDDIVSTALETFGAEQRAWITDIDAPKYKDFIQRNHINCCSLYKKEMWSRIGGYDENMKIGFEDWDFWCRATREGYSVTIIREFLFYYRKHATSMFADAQKRRQEIIDYMMSKYGLKDPVDVVYVLGDESAHNDMELRYSLRSLERYCIGWRDVYIVGHKPSWISGVKHIPFYDIHAKAQNIMIKTAVACAHWPHLSDTILMMNDDHFYNAPVNVSVYPYYYSDAARDQVMARDEWDSYREIVNNTEKLTPGGHYYDIHKPIRYDRKCFLDMEKNWPHRKYDHGLLVKSSYCWYHDIQGTESTDCILRDVMSTDDIERTIAGSDVWSMHDEAIDDNLIAWLERKYPEPSRFE